jgi:hypothetical protein
MLTAHELAVQWQCRPLCQSHAQLREIGWEGIQFVAIAARLIAFNHGLAALDFWNVSRNESHVG